MNEQKETKVASERYQPDYIIEVPPPYKWLPRPLATMRYYFFDMLFPWGFIYLGLAVLSWNFLTPSVETMSELKPGWIALIWVRNAALLTIIAGGLHWWLYMRRSQNTEFKFHRKWMATSNKKFLWGNQVWDNMFWSIVSGVTIWSLFEAVTHWFYASGRLPYLSISENPIYFLIWIPGALLWSTAHFYFNHRFLHWKPLYDISHELHHRNVNVGPWTGISMHPIEHLIYFTLFVLWWVAPVHPVIFIFGGFFNGLSPAVSHSGFDQLKLGEQAKVTAGDWYHQLHHQYFKVNFGNTPTPFDRIFGSWHDGSQESLALQMERMQER